MPPQAGPPGIPPELLAMLAGGGQQGGPQGMPPPGVMPQQGPPGMGMPQGPPQGNPLQALLGGGGPPGMQQGLPQGNPMQAILAQTGGGPQQGPPMGQAAPMNPVVDVYDNVPPIVKEAARRRLFTEGM